MKPLHNNNYILCTHFISKASCDWSKCWHVTSKLKFHQSMKLKVIQPRPLPGFMFANKTTKDCIQFFYKSYDSFWLRYLNDSATPTNRKDNQQCTIQINWQLTELDGYQKFSAIRGTAYKNKNKITGEHSIVVTDLTTNLRQHPHVVS